MPATLKSLLAARLDRLDTGERLVLERGAVEGEVFHRGAVQALGPEDTEVRPRLAGLVRRELIRPDIAQFRHERAFRFCHLLIRDAAYDGMAKATRAELHERFAGWLEQRGDELVELDEILGYHLEQVCRYRAELGLPQDDELAASARRRLTAAGRRASLRSDYRAAVSLFERAATLVPPPDLDLALETELVDALFETGRGVEALRRADTIVERASVAGDRVSELSGRIQAGVIRLYLEPEGAAERLSELVGQSLPVFRAAGHDLALYIADRALGLVANMRAQTDSALEAYERAAVHARRAGLPHEFLDWRSSCLFHGSTPVPGILEWLDEHEPRVRRDPWLRAYRAGALAMLGRFDEARAILVRTRAELAERGGGSSLGSLTAQNSVDVELLAGEAAAAATLGEEGCRLLDELGEANFLSTAAGKLAQAYFALGRIEDADAWAGRAAELGASDDALTQMLWRQVRAKVCARRGELADAERLSREAVAIGERTDLLDRQGDTYADLADVLALAERRQEAARALERALERYTHKGNLVSAQHVRARFAELQHTASAPRDSA